MQKCKRCGAPLEGFLYKTIGKLMGIKPSESDPELCNKCEEETGQDRQPFQNQSAENENTEQSASQEDSSADLSVTDNQQAGAEQGQEQIDNSEQNSEDEANKDSQF